MNKELIEKLAEQATRREPRYYPGNDGHPEYEDVFDKQKFTELLILECEKVAKNPNWYGESPSNGWRNPIRHVCNVIKEHFGIKS